MALPATDISDILNHLHSSVDAMHRSMQELCDPASHHAYVSRLQEECERKIVELRDEHQKIKKKAEERLQAEEIETAKKRKKQEQEIAERRRKEDEEREKRIEEEEMLKEKEIREENSRMEQEKAENEHKVTTNTQEKIHKLESEMRKRWEEGRVNIRALDEKRKELNWKIDEMLALPMAYPEMQSTRKTGIDAAHKNSPASSLPAKLYHSDPMAERLWGGETYASGKYLQNLLRPDAMLNRLQSWQKYPLYVPIESREDPMLDRLWNGETYGCLQKDPMIMRLWSDTLYSGRVEEQNFDPMLNRLWSDDRYPNENYISVIHNPMIDRLWDDICYPSDMFISIIYDPMLSRLWSSEEYTENNMLAHYNDPILARLWNDNPYGEQNELEDPMMQRLWSATRYRADPMINRLFNPTRYREDPMIRRLWVSADHIKDPMIDRLWNGKSYSIECHQEKEPQEVLFTSEPADVKSPIPRSPIPKGLYLHSGKYPDESVSEVQDIGDDKNEDEDIDMVTSSKRQSGVFTAFFDSIRTDIPLVNDYFKHQEYDTVPIEDFDDYVQQEPLLYHAPNEQHVHFEDLLPSEYHDFDIETDGEDEFPFRNDTNSHVSSASLRIQTSSIPPPLSENPFDAHFPSSGVPSSPATPSDTDSHAFQHLEMHHEHERGTIPDSWSPPREEVHLASRIDKPVAATNPFASYMQSPMSSSGVNVEAQASIPKLSAKRGVGNHFNSVPQNPRLSVLAEVEGAEEEESGGVRERAAFFGRLSRMYYGGSGEERGRLLGVDETR